MEVTSFSTWEELQEAVGVGNTAADEDAKSDPQTWKVGDFFMRLIPEMALVVYGEILDPVESNRKAGGPEEETEHLRRQYAKPYLKFTRWTRCYSSLITEGEFGNTHCTSMNAKLSKEEFERARASGWPSNRDGVLAVFGTPSTGTPETLIEA